MIAVVILAPAALAWATDASLIAGILIGLVLSPLAAMPLGWIIGLVRP
ncbi:hypothetical protein [Thermodesulfomicrobium sp. WS]|nr:hypothetical protein [Thermodesulfomicrobium sp. WS]